LSLRCRLLRLLEGELRGRERRRLEASLAVSSRLRRERDEMALGLAAAEGLRGGERLDPARAAAMEAALRRSAVAPVPRPRRMPLAWAAVAVLGAGALLLAAAWDPGLRLVEGGERPDPLEAAALGLYERLADERLDLELATSSPREARRYVQGSGLDAALVERRPGGRYRLRGVTRTAVAGAPALAVAYRIDGVPALLLTTKAEAVPGGPEHWSRFRRELRHRAAGARRVLSWANSGQRYVLVSGLPGHGQQSCGICHAGPERSRLVELAADAL
jgi:hypothetical protein